jgi:plasmid stabilization system protein ParE
VKVLLHPAAEVDVAEAAEYYARTGSPAVAAKFVAEFGRVANLLVEYPNIGSPRSQGRRGFSMSLFPYTVIYRASGDTMLILVVKHDSRRPGFGGSRK